MEEGYKLEWKNPVFYLYVYAWSYINSKFSIPEVEFFFSGMMSDLRNTFVTSGTKEMIIILNVHKKMLPKYP